MNSMWWFQEVVIVHPVGGNEPSLTTQQLRSGPEGIDGEVTWQSKPQMAGESTKYIYICVFHYIHIILIIIISFTFSCNCRTPTYTY